MVTKHKARVTEISEQESLSLRDAVMKLVPNFAPRKYSEGVQFYNWTGTRSVTLALSYKGGEATTSILLSFNFVLGYVTIEQFYISAYNSPSTQFGNIPFSLKEGEPLERALKNRKLVATIKEAALKAEKAFLTYSRSVASFYQNKQDLWN